MEDNNTIDPRTILQQLANPTFHVTPDAWARITGKAPKTVYITFEIRIDGVLKPNICFPPKLNFLLDERLDEARLSEKHVATPLYTPLTPVEIKVNDTENDYVFNFLIASDESVEVPVGSGIYNHEITLIEETKLLEGIMTDSLTFKNDLGRNYTANAKKIKPEIEYKSSTNVPPIVNDVPIYISPLKSGTNFTFVSLSEVFGAGNVFEQYVKIYYNGTYLTGMEERGGELPGLLPQSKETFQVNVASGNYEVSYYAYIYGKKPTTVTYTFTAVANAEPLPRWNIATVISRVLDVAEPHVNGEQPKYSLNAEQAEEFAKIEAPEFAFTRSTLKEILDQIGGYIHGIPRLKGNLIYYDMLGGTTQAKVFTQNTPYVTKIQTQNVESYCTRLDSNVDNLVNMLNPAEGVITEPYNGGYKTTRTELVYARIEEGNYCIETQFPIQDITKLECGFLPQNNAVKGGDLTPYVFEVADYKRMSSFDELYPTSRAYALYFTQGQKNIYGLDFKVKDAMGGVFKKYAIANIIKETSGVDITGSVINATDYTQLAFSITYTPVFGARVSQTKQYIGDIKNPRTLAFNQSANQVETRYYGENIKGVIARMGNPEMVITYRLKTLSLMPALGEMYGNDYFVSSVACEIQPTFISCMVGFSKDFNRLSQYIGINSQKRYYEISEKQVTRRDILYNDYLVVGDSVERDSGSLIYSYGLQKIGEIFTQEDSSSVPVSGVDAQSRNLVSDGASVRVGVKCVLPVISTAMGDAMVFTFRYEDNYGAGNQAQYLSEGNVKGSFTNAVAYTDYYGRADLLEFYFRQRYQTPTDFSNQTRLGNALPQYVGGYPSSAVIGTPSGRELVIRKDGAEALSVSYQVEFATNRQNYILGSALSRNCPLVRGHYANHSAQLYILSKRLGKFASVVDLAGATLLADYGLDTSKILVNENQIKIADETSTVDGVAWAIVDKESKELLIGCNAPVAVAEVLAMPYITPKHKIFN